MPHQILVFEASGIPVILALFRKQVLKLIFQKENGNSLNPLNFTLFLIRSLEGGGLGFLFHCLVLSVLKVFSLFVLEGMKQLSKIQEIYSTIHMCRDSGWTENHGAMFHVT